MATQNIFRAIPIEGQRIGISVLPDMAESLHKFLTDNGLECSPVGTEVFEIPSLGRDDSGNPVRGELELVRIFTVRTSMMRLQDLGHKWPSTW